MVSSAFHLLGIVWISRRLSLMTSETAHLIQCLQQIHKVIGKANEILAGVSNPSVCSEVLLSKPGTAYILGLFEVYRVSKRLEEGVKTRQPASELLRHTLREVDLAWNNLLSFLVFGHPMLQMLLLESSAESNTHLSGPNPALGQVCGVCLTEVRQESEVTVVIPFLEGETAHVASIMLATLRRRRISESSGEGKRL